MFKKKILAAMIAVDLLILTAGLGYGFYSGKLVVTSPAYTAALTKVAAKNQELVQLETQLASSAANVALLQQTITEAESNTTTTPDPTQLNQLQAQLKTKQNEVYGAKIQYHDYLQGQMVLKRGQAAIDLYKNNYPFILDPNLNTLTAQAKATYYKLLAEQTQLQAQIDALTKDQQQAAQNLATAKAQLPAAESTLSELTAGKTELEQERVELEVLLSKTKHWTQRVQEWLQKVTASDSETDS